MYFLWNIASPSLFVCQCSDFGRQKFDRFSWEISQTSEWTNGKREGGAVFGEELSQLNRARLYYSEAARKLNRIDVVLQGVSGKSLDFIAVGNVESFVRCGKVQWEEEHAQLPEARGGEGGPLQAQTRNSRLELYFTKTMRE